MFLVNPGENVNNNFTNKKVCLTKLDLDNSFLKSTNKLIQSGNVHNGTLNICINHYANYPTLPQISQWQEDQCYVMLTSRFHFQWDLLI